MAKLAIEQLQDVAKSFLVWVRGNPWPFFLLVGGLAAFVWVLIETIRLDNMGFEKKTFWQWMELLLVPTALALAGFWFSRVQKATELEIAEKAREEDRELAKQENDTDREIARDRQRQNTFDAYLDKMTELLLERGLGTSVLGEEEDHPDSGRSGDLAVSIAKARTLSVLRTLDPIRVSAVFRFLMETEVGDNSLAELVPLSGGSLRGVQWHGYETVLSEVNLSNVNLLGANLSGAILVRTNFSGAYMNLVDLRGTDLLTANLQEAWLRGAKLSKADLNTADLRGADLQEANLTGANLLGANLTDANLSLANLSEVHLAHANMKGANLKGAVVTTEQLLRVQPGYLDGATMPDGTKYEEWIKRHRGDAREGIGTES